MGWSFRKRIKIAPGVRMNISKRGTSFTVGPRGANVNIGKRGTYQNLSIRGTGLSSRRKVSNSGCLIFFAFIFVATLSTGILLFV